MLEVVELRRELEGLEQELAAAQRDAAHASNRVRGSTGEACHMCCSGQLQQGCGLQSGVGWCRRCLHVAPVTKLLP